MLVKVEKKSTVSYKKERREYIIICVCSFRNQICSFCFSFFGGLMITIRSTPALHRDEHLLLMTHSVVEGKSFAAMMIFQFIFPVVTSSFSLSHDYIHWALLGHRYSAGAVMAAVPVSSVSRYMRLYAKAPVRPRFSSPSAFSMPRHRDSKQMLLQC